MNTARKAFILKLLRRHNIMSLATVRPDGFPQVTTVAYANDGLDLYSATAVAACARCASTTGASSIRWSTTR